MLRRHADDIRKFHATGLFLFGSAARDELRPDSDVDLFVDYVRDGSFTFVELFQLEELLKVLMRRRVHLTTRDGLHPLLRMDIENTCIRVL